MQRLRHMNATVASRLLAALLVLGVITTAARAQTDKDGWAKTSLNDAGLSGDKLHAMSVALRSDQFRKIGSVVIARHGKLAFEDYVEGDANTLRDTRSATKSITGALVGLAVQEGKLSGVEAQVLDLLPEHARRIQNPDPRKSKIKVE